MQPSKTFRLFISSTFNDFRREREVLQTEVFPEIKSYCAKKGYTFQPIDLRWGVTQEAQLDQKTLELCLNEVQTCKSYPYPNFLFMLGDRYGWIPLPYTIEENEFEEILSLADPNEQKLLLKWYQKDLNQLPPSYILKERRREYEDFDKWRIVEDKIRTIFQKTVDKSSLSNSQKQKYFLSATEAEIIEGIIPYMGLTKHQKKLIQEDPNIQKVDVNYIFGFFREIDKNSKIKDKFITNDYDKAQNLKQNLKKMLLKENILEINTTQISENNLEETYLEEFKTKVTNFLIEKIDLHIAKEQKFTPLQTELQAQEFFAKEKQKNFIGQEATLNRVLNYINDNNNTPLIIYGKSGSGKSALMAKAIFKAKEQTNKKIIYRFIGATANTTSSKEVLTSIFEELGINLNTNKQIDIKDIQNQESFEDFSYRVYDEFLNIKDEVVIFIDAVDQFVNLDQFLWLPKKLPKNVKIVISSLNDKAYKEDSQYFKTLKSKTKNLIEIKEFNKPLELLHKLLNKENRTLQKHQEEYFLQQYQNVKSPLYVVIVAQELKHWKSFDAINEPKTLTNTQKGAIKEFINNLSQFHHHDKDFVKRVLGYIYASRDGLSESEILQLISVDEEFLEQVAPSTYHENKSGELPVVIWARLYTQLKPFLSKKTQDSEELLYFFHREFEEVISKDKEQKAIHQKIIEATQELIKKYQDDDFYSNRWGMLSVLTLFVFEQFELKEKNSLYTYTKFINSIKKQDWLENFVIYLGKEIIAYKQKNDNIKLPIIVKINFAFISELYNQNKKFWRIPYRTAKSLISAVKYFINIDIDNTDIITEKELEKYQKLALKDIQKYGTEYYQMLLDLVSFYKNNNMQKAINLIESKIDILKELYCNTDNLDTYLIFIKILFELYRYIENLNEKNLRLLKKEILYLENFFNNNKEFDDKLLYLGFIFTTISAYKITNKLEDYLECIDIFIKLLDNIIKKYYKYFARDYVEYLYQFIEKCKNTKSKLEIFDSEIENIMRNLLPKLNKINSEFGQIETNNIECNKEKILELESLVLKSNISKNINDIKNEYFNNIFTLCDCYYEREEYKKAIKVLIINLPIIRKLFNKDKLQWIDSYSMVLENLSHSLIKIKRYDDAEQYLIEKLNAYKKLYLEDETWAKEYLEELDNLSCFYQGKDTQKTLELKEESVKILRSLYAKNPDHWFLEFLPKIYELIDLYKMYNRYLDVKLLEIEKEKISKKFNIPNKAFYGENIDNIEDFFTEEEIENQVKIDEEYIDNLIDNANELYNEEKIFESLEAYEELKEILFKLKNDDPTNGGAGER